MFRPSSRAHYALRAMTELSLREGTTSVSLREIAWAQRLSLKYLEQLAMALSRAGLVRAERGPGGGYRLARPAEDITVREVVEAMEGPLCVSGRQRAGNGAEVSATQHVWERVAEAVASVLSQTVLADLRDAERAAVAGAAPGYQI